MDEKGNLRHISLAVLGLINEEESHPYEINQKIETRGMRNWTKVGKSSIYSVLNTLEGEGLVLSRTETVNNRIQKKFQITSNGIEILQDNVYRILSEGERLDQNFDLAFSNLPVLEKDRQIEAISTCLENLQKNSALLEDMLQNYRGAPIFIRGLFTRPIKIIAANIEFCKEVLTELQEGK